ncbi:MULTISPECIES: hypothetical protein [unclassified Serratia (in: enterobacteria)]|uniref:hypothetical protein n=1 Tax=unclassified Serratia (in: enterobacteria) TaxID=2647522 RepID=UPI0027FE68F3|nr:MULTISPECIES: hypothetical protein [unclassified Serratia (in: enterobacteria)]MDQ7097217.1 hypothetical protein [Serratia sp. MF2]MDQ7103615.1 hypothetical protein [Serratia sp. MF1(2023)]
MTISFEKALSKLKARTVVLDSAFERNLLVANPNKCADRYAVQEGLMSSLWQAWCMYCRTIIFGSLTDGLTVNGNRVSSAYSHLTDRELVFLAQKASQGANLAATIVRSAQPHIEMTWGDALKLNPVITAFNPTNSGILISGLGAVSLLLDLQKFRNANAHITSFTIGEVKRAQVRYTHTKFRHPSDTMFWIDPQTNDYLWKSWIEEIELISDAMAQ